MGLAGIRGPVGRGCASRSLLGPQCARLGERLGEPPPPRLPASTCLPAAACLAQGHRWHGRQRQLPQFTGERIGCCGFIQSPEPHVTIACRDPGGRRLQEPQRLQRGLSVCSCGRGTEEGEIAA